MIEAEFFRRKRFSAPRAEAFGFRKTGDGYVYEADFMDGEFHAVITVDGEENVSGKVIDKMNDEEYLKIKSDAPSGAYVSTVRSSYEALLGRIAEGCFDDLLFVSDQANRIASLVKMTYGVVPDFPFRDEKYSPSGVFRHTDSGKWFGLIMNVRRGVLAKEPGGEPIDVMNLKIDPDDGEALRSSAGIYPAYHMNHKSWISVTLDGTLDDDRVMELIGESFRLTDKIKK